MPVNISNSSVVIPSELLLAVRGSRCVTVLTGSGISAESGVPTFRQAQTGLWSKFDPETLATPEAFERDPELVWRWYRWRRKLIRQARPNPGHLALVEMNLLFESFNLITQNVDGLHQLAGNSPVLELHGNIMRSRCAREGVIVAEKSNSSDELPYCPECGSILRPDVVWFGESLPQKSYQRALVAAQNCDIFFSIGTSAIVQPAASLAMEARANGAKIVEINIEETPLSRYADFVFSHSAGRVLPSIVDALK